MTPEAFERAALALPATALSIQWGDDRVYKLGGKMFAATNGASSNLSLKMTEIAYEALIETGRGRRAPYMPPAAAWVAFDDLAGLDAREVEGWLATAHALVAARLTKKLRAELGLV
jgi:predicted DNA-binding protein (MmcQ/YjbR family)